jgi:hypothetical protein
MKTVVGVAFLALAAFGLSFAVSSNAPDRPPGVAADRWAPISNTLGVVLVPDMEQSGLPRLAPRAIGPPPDAAGPGPAPRLPPLVVGAVDPTGLFAEPSPAVQAIIDEGRPVRGYLMVKRGKVWRPLTVVPPTVDY